MFFSRSTFLSVALLGFISGGAAPALAHELALNAVTVEIAGKSVAAYALNGKVLYTFEKDLRAKGSTCSGVCAEFWPPILLTDQEVRELVSHGGEVEVYAADGTESHKEGFSVIARGQGKHARMQLAFNGWPLYHYVFDRSETDAYGDEHNPGGVDAWYTFTADFKDHD